MFVLVPGSLAQTPAPAQLPQSSLSEVERAELGAAIQAELSACWMLPAAYIGRVITVRLTLAGDGALKRDPEVSVEGEKDRAKLAPFIASAVRAVNSCAPFAAFASLGADPTESFVIDVTFMG